MSETPKRRRGDRRDAVLLRETDALHFIMGIIYPHRADNEAYIAERIDLEPIKAYLAKKNVEGIEFKYTFFHVIVAALVKTITLRPKLNRFYANENYYQRNKVTAGFIIKKEFSDGSEEAVALLDAAPTDTVDTVHEEIRRRLYATRHEQKLNTTDNSMDILNKLPRFLSKAAIRFIRWLDRHGILQYWLFSKGVKETKNNHGGNELTMNYVDRENNSFRNIKRQQYFFSEITQALCAPNVTEE